MTARPSPHPRRRTTSILALAGALLALTGCSTEAQIQADVEEENSLPAPSEPAGEPLATAGPVEVTVAPFELIADATGVGCRDSAYPDEVTYDVSFRSNVGLKQVRYSLDGVGVSTDGPIRVVPPVNFGGRIDFGGSAQPGRGNLLDGAPGLDYDSREPAVLKSYLPGETGLLVWPIQIDATAEEPATISSFSASYTTTSGQVGSVEVPADLTYLVSDDCDAALSQADGS